MVFTIPGQRFASRPLLKRLDDPDHTLLIQATGDYRGFRSHAARKEPWTFDWLKEVDETCHMWDVGACVGSYGLMAAARGAKVTAFEPLDINFAELEANVKANKLDEKVKPVQAALGVDELIVRERKMPAGWGLATTDRILKDWKSPVRVRVESMSMDEALSEHGQPTHVKIDVEDGCLKCVSSGDRVWQGVQTAIIEISSDSHEQAIMDHLGERGLVPTWRAAQKTFENRTVIYRRRDEDA